MTTSISNCSSNRSRHQGPNRANISSPNYKKIQAVVREDALQSKKFLLQYWPSRSSKVDGFPLIWKSVCDILLVINSKFGPISYRLDTIHPWPEHRHNFRYEHIVPQTRHSPQHSCSALNMNDFGMNVLCRRTSAVPWPTSSTSRSWRPTGANPAASRCAVWPAPAASWRRGPWLPSSTRRPAGWRPHAVPPRWSVRWSACNARAPCAAASPTAGQGPANVTTRPTFLGCQGRHSKGGGWKGPWTPQGFMTSIFAANRTFETEQCYCCKNNTLRRRRPPRITETAPTIFWNDATVSCAYNSAVAPGVTPIGVRAFSDGEGAKVNMSL